MDKEKIAAMVARIIVMLEQRKFSAAESMALFIILQDMLMDQIDKAEKASAQVSEKP